MGLQSPCPPPLLHQGTIFITAPMIAPLQAGMFTMVVDSLVSVVDRQKVIVVSLELVVPKQ